MTEEHWPTLEETEAEDKAVGRIDEAKVAEHRARMRCQCDCHGICSCDLSVRAWRCHKHEGAHCRECKAPPVPENGGE